MPTKPKKVELNADGAQLTNAILNEMNSTNPNYSPTIRADGTLQSMQAVGRIVMGNSEWANQFINILFNKIVIDVIQSYSFENPLKKFKRGMLEAGDAVNEIAFDLAEPHGYDTTEDNEFPKQEKELLYAAIHRVNYAAYYKKTVNRNMLLKAFTTVNGMRDFADQIIDSMYQTAEVDEYIGMKYVVARAYLDGYVKNYYISDTSETSLKKIAGILKGISNDMTIVGEEYNAYRVPTSTPKDRQVVLINPIFDGSFEVDVLAYAFNAENAEINGQKVYYTSITAQESQRMQKLTTHNGQPGVALFTNEELALLRNIPLFVVDERFFMVFDYVFEMTNFFNPEKMYWNYWLHCWKILSASPFVNAIAISTNDIQVSNITIEADGKLVVNKGGTLVLSTNQTPNAIPVSPQWSISGETSSQTYITPYGVLFVDNKEKATTITVTATVENTSPVLTWNAESESGIVTASVEVQING